MRSNSRPNLVRLDPTEWRDSSPAADPNGDGVNNLLAYALRGNPLANAAASRPVAEPVVRCSP